LVLRDLELLIRARYSIIFLDTAEEERAESLLKHLADSLGIAFFTWTPTKGLRRSGGGDTIYGTVKPIGAFSHIENSQLFSAIYHFQSLGPHLGDPLLTAAIKDAAQEFKQRTGAIVLTGAGLALPEALKPLSTTLKLPPPCPADYRDTLARILRDLSARKPVKVEIGAQDLNRLLNNLRGLTLLEAGKVLTKAILEDGKLAADDIQKVIEAKRAIVERDGLLEYYPVQETMDDIADLAGLKDWLRKRAGFMKDPARAASFGLPFPKGVLLLGVQGCGKSLCAKAVAQEWGLPLLKLDPSNLYNKYLGETEKNFQRAIRLAEQMAPLVLWIDEIEKAFATAGGDADAGVSQRIFGTFLSWLQDRKGDVFVVATANDLARLPPEFIRKGRFDEIFFVDLPDAAARKSVFEIHLRRRGLDPAGFALEELVARSDGFSGSEIEQAIVSGLYSAFAAGAPLSSDLLKQELAQTRPLSQTMAEKIAWLREWAKERTVSAG